MLDAGHWMLANYECLFLYPESGIQHPVSVRNGTLATKKCDTEFKVFAYEDSKLRIGGGKILWTNIKA
jgi:hypothetical protein